MYNLSDKDIEEFLNEPRIAKIATIKKDGSPHITPVWYEYSDKKIKISTVSERFKTKNIKRDNRVAVLIDSVPDGRKVVIFEGSATITPDPEGTLIKKLIRKYIPKEKWEEADKSYMTPTRVILTVEPKKVISWDFSRN